MGLPTDGHVAKKALQTGLMNHSTRMFGSGCHHHATVQRCPGFSKMSRLPGVDQDISQSHGTAQSTSSDSVAYCSVKCCAAFGQDSNMLWRGVVYQL